MGDHTLAFELYYDGTWREAPVYVRDGCVIQRGATSPGQATSPSSGSATLDNNTGLYSPRSVASSLYGKIGQNTPARYTVDGSVRMTGEVASWTPDRAVVGDAWTKLDVAGVLQRIGRGTDPLASPIYRSLLPLEPAAYYPLTDGSGSTTAEDVIGGPPLQVLGSPSMGSVTGPGAGDTKHPEFMGSGGFVGGLKGLVPVATTGQWTIEFSYRATSSSTNANAPVVQWRSTGTYAALSWLINIEKFGSSNTVSIINQADWSTASSISYSGISAFDGEWHQVRVSLSRLDATHIHTEITVDGVLTTTNSTVTAADTIGDLVDVEVGNLNNTFNGLYITSGVDSLSVADLAIWSTATVDSTYDASTGYNGETAADRFTRLCGEEAIPATVVGTAADSVAMGPQRSITLLALLDEIARTDDASIFETRDSSGLTMRTGQSKLNQDPALTLTYLGEVRPPLGPVYGDEGIRNDVTATSPRGSSRRVVQATGPHNVQLPEDDPQGVGRYQTRIDVNPEDDDSLGDAAGWRVNLGTYDGTWYARITVDLDAAPSIAATVAAVDIGDVVALTDLPVDEALETVESLVIGIAEDVLPKRRLVTFFTVPAAPYRVGILASASGDTDPMLGRLDTDGSSTVSTVAVGASSFQVATPSGPLWTTTADDFPLDVIAGGQRVSISGITGASSPQTFTVQASGKQVRYQIPSGSRVNVADPIILTM
jgi:hypothetical protein